MHIGSPLTGKATGEEHTEVPKKQSSVLDDKFLSTFFSAHHETATRKATNGNCIVHVIIAQLLLHIDTPELAPESKGQASSKGFSNYNHYILYLILTGPVDQTFTMPTKLDDRTAATSSDFSTS